jgi:hypothetical protein
MNMVNVAKHVGGGGREKLGRGKGRGRGRWDEVIKIDRDQIMVSGVIQRILNFILIVL